jgi:hypothetical protein
MSILKKNKESYIKLKPLISFRSKVIPKNYWKIPVSFG